ncbi:MAG: hypothetical protein E6K74_10415 [Candidatus Eisenbacteria bacterium]|uniref:Glycoside hydrolase family 57 N-terminal domain-containing protein n=1 Tax=Eiseniibacteriota bacterium TaxID=2212470 RepID=A0A538SPD0_UNCEI|nr:MAG: hypothetical protein E6K74_10415 [Candidatus Eisenbacteria bacterium]
MAEPTLLALVWHMHQPSYRDALSGRVLLPWTRLHATKDYGDMVSALRPHPRVHATFNLTPVLLDQLEAIASGTSDDFLDLARKPAESLTPEEQRFLTRHFFSVNPERMLEPHPRYRELKARSSTPQGGARAPREPPLTPDEIRDLQTWFHLAWVDPMYRDEEPIRSLLQKGRGFTEAEKRSLLDWGVACAARVIGTYRDAASTGQIEIATSAYHHPILPLLISTDAPREVSPSIRLPIPAFQAPGDAAEHLRRARESHTRRFGAAPRGTWPPEGALNQAALELLREAGFAWCASDEAVLARALGRAEPGGENWTAALCRSYRVETKTGPLAIVFRDRLLSDRIGFVYAAWQPDRAADRTRRTGSPFSTRSTAGSPRSGGSKRSRSRRRWPACHQAKPFLTCRWDPGSRRISRCGSGTPRRTARGPRSAGSASATRWPARTVGCRRIGSRRPSRRSWWQRRAIGFGGTATTIKARTRTSSTLFSVPT